MTTHGIQQGHLAAITLISQPAIAQLVNHGIWPKRNPDGVRQQISLFLSNKGIDPANAFEAVQAKETACTGIQPKANKEGDDTMLPKKYVLKPETKKHFGLFLNPFADEAMKSAEDVFLTPDARYVREALFQTALHGGFMAIIGESGAGKSTLRRELIERIKHSGKDIIVIEPYIIAMEDDDNKGKTLKAASIVEAILTAVSPGKKVMRTPEARFRQLHEALKEGGHERNHVLIIEEAHSLPLPTLKHLKRFFELENGFKKLLSIILIGQPELKDRLSGRWREVREVSQRCETIELAPLDKHLEAFLAFKFERVGKPVAEVLDESAFDAIRASLANYGGDGVPSRVYPLAVSNLVIAAMNAAAELCMPTVTNEVFKNLK
nr:AAA family ATPase [Yersinia aldovae]